MSAATGTPIGKRQVEELAARAAQYFDDFYVAREAIAEETSDLLVLTFDGKGIPMLREHLRPETRKAAEATPRRLRTRLTKGEKPHRKRMAQVAAVYTVAQHIRTLQDVVADLRPVRDAGKERVRPRPTNKRVWASVEKDSEVVIRDAFEDARRRDPEKKRTWVVLVDGNRDQLRLVKQAARKLGVAITIIVDLIHVLEYLWRRPTPFTPTSRRRLRAGCNSGSCGFSVANTRRSAPTSGATRPLATSKRRSSSRSAPVSDTSAARATTSATTLHSPRVCRSPPVSSRAPVATS